MDASSRRRATRGAASRNALVAGVSLLGTLTMVAGEATSSSASAHPSSVTAKAKGSSSTTLVVVQSAQANSFAYDGGSDTSNEDTELSTNTMGNLVRYEYQGDTQNWNAFQPELAENWTVSKNGLVYTFHLRHGVFGASGDQFSAADVMYSFERKFSTATSSDKFLFSEIMSDPIKDFNEVNNYTVQFHIKQASYGEWFLGLMSNEMGDIYDAQVLKAHATSSDPYAVLWSESHGGWGLGAYDVTSEVPGESITLTANPHYVLGPVYYKKVIINVVSDPGTEVDLLESQSADIAEDLSPAEQSQLRYDHKISVPKVEYPTEYLSVADVVPNAPFNKVAVRQAWRYAIPYQKIIDSVYAGSATATAGPLDPNEEGYDGTGLEPGTYDPTLAKQLLAKAGYPNGLTFTLTYATGSPDVDEAAILIQSYAAAGGFNVQLNQLSTAGFAAIKNSKTAQALLLDDRGFVQTPGYLLGTFWSIASGGTSYGGYDDTTFNNLLAAANALPDPNSKSAGVLWNAAQRFLQKESPSQLIAKVQEAVALNGSITGYEYRSDSSLDYSMMKMK